MSTRQRFILVLLLIIFTLGLIGIYLFLQGSFSFGKKITVFNQTRYSSIRMGAQSAELYQVLRNLLGKEVPFIAINSQKTAYTFRDVDIIFVEKMQPVSPVTSVFETTSNNSPEFSHYLFHDDGTLGIYVHIDPTVIDAIEAESVEYVLNWYLLAVFDRLQANLDSGLALNKHGEDMSLRIDIPSAQSEMRELYSLENKELQPVILTP